MDSLWGKHGGAWGPPRAAAILHRRGGSLGGDCQIRRPKAGKSGAGTGTAVDRSRLPFTLGIQRRGHRRRLYAAFGRPPHRLGEVSEREALSGATACATGISRLPPTGVGSPHFLAAPEGSRSSNGFAVPAGAAAEILGARISLARRDGDHAMGDLIRDRLLFAQAPLFDA